MIPPVLCYHRIGGPPVLGVTRVARSVFGRQMTGLARAGWRTLGLAEFEARVIVPASPEPERALLLTFDDGLASLAEHVFPVLRDLGMMATVFLVTDYIGRPNTWDVRYTWRRERHLDWPTIERWAGRGFDFQSHTRTHARLTWLSDAEASSELVRARETLMARLGPQAGVAIAFPFGASDARIERLGRAAGYRLGFAAVRSASTGPLALPRVPVYMWDAWDVPFGLRTDGLGALGRWVANVANRCAVGTSIMQGVWGRVSGVRRGRHLTPDT